MLIRAFIFVTITLDNFLYITHTHIYFSYVQLFLKKWYKEFHGIAHKAFFVFHQLLDKFGCKTKTNKLMLRWMKRQMFSVKSLRKQKWEKWRCFFITFKYLSSYATFSCEKIQGHDLLYTQIIFRVAVMANKIGSKLGIFSELSLIGRTHWKKSLITSFVDIFLTG